MPRSATTLLCAVDLSGCSSVCLCPYVYVASRRIDFDSHSYEELASQKAWQRSKNVNKRKKEFFIYS
jgi:hypothetical protein